MKGQFFHSFNRGVEKREIFLNDDYHLRFVYSLYDFNNVNLAFDSYYKRRKKPLLKIHKPKDELVDIICWVLMPNHYHILLREKIDGGIGMFTKKLGNGYTQYFNLQNERSGVLFQGRSKTIQILRDEQFLYIPYYIFANPLKLIYPFWELDGIKNLKKAVHFLENYRWSGYMDLVGKQNFSFVTNKKLFFELFDTNERTFKKDFVEWLSSRGCDPRPKGKLVK